VADAAGHEELENRVGEVLLAAARALADDHLVALDELGVGANDAF
jgi:hypothetical protein